MNNLLKTTLSSVLAASLLSVSMNFSGAAAAFADENSASADGSAASEVNKTELRSENIKFEYLSTVFNGKTQTPAVTVSSGGKTLVEGTDFSVSYPEDAVNAGLKTLSVSGLGSYSGSFSATYRILPLDVSGSDVQFTAVADPCTYNGFARTPEFQLAANRVNIPGTNYTKNYSNNVNASDKAVCEFIFNGNFTGKRTAEFTISKAKHDDLDLEIPLDLAAANGAYNFTYDLSRLLVQGAHFGAPVYSPWDFPNGDPTVAFNELRCTVCDSVNNVVVSVPVLDADNFVQFSVNFYFKDSKKICPKLFIAPIIHEYDGEPVSGDEFEKSGCYAYVNGNRISGRWIFWKEQSGEPHTASASSFTFEPDDPAYESVDSVVFITVNKIAAPSISVRLNRDSVEVGVDPILTVSGVPDELLDQLKIECSPLPEQFSFEEYPTRSSPKFKLSLPYERGIYTITASIPGDDYRLTAEASAEINVGKYVPPEQQITDKVTTAEELAELIAAAPVNGFVTAQGMRSLSEASLQAASQKRLTLEIKLNDTYTWILRTADVPADTSSLDLELGSAAIPAVLTERIGGTVVNSFTVSGKNFDDFAELRITMKNSKLDKFANLFFYNSNGELEFDSCMRIESDNTVKFPVTKSGKFVIITDSETKLPGDLDNSGKLELNDVTYLLRAYINDDFSTDLYKFDIDLDGKFTLYDVTKLLRIYLAV